VTPEVYAALDAVGAAALVRQGEVSPQELLEAAVAQIERFEPSVQAIVTRLFDRARGQVARGLPKGPLQGVPFLMKDLGAADAGVPQMLGSVFLAQDVPRRDDALTARYKRAGLVILGRTKTPEFGILGTTEPKAHGPAHNPWNLAHSPGGSSGGSAAAVAARMVPAAHAGDGGGSIRIPAANCGLVGLKPSRGRTPFGPEHGEAWSGLTQQHVVTRTVRDSAAFLDLFTPPEPGAPYVAPAPERPYAEEVGRDPGRLRIAFTTDALLGSQLHPDNRTAVERAAATLEGLGHHVEPGVPALDKELLIRAYLATVAANVAAEIDAASARMGRRPGPGELEDPTLLLELIGRSLRATELIALQRRVQAVGHRVAEFFGKFDVLVTATTGRPPLRLGETDPTALERALIQTLRRLPSRALLDRAFDRVARARLDALPNTQPWNLLGLPAISLPLAWTDGGLPLGVQFVAPFGGEARLLRLAAQLEGELRWDLRRPPLVADAGA
jgi:amidase